MNGTATQSRTITRIPVTGGMLRVPDSTRFSWKYAAVEHVYLAWSHNDVLLYIGRTNDPNTRLRQHRAKAPWWEAVDHIELVPVHSIAEAGLTETALIQHLQPAHNRLCQIIG